MLTVSFLHINIAYYFCFILGKLWSRSLKLAYTLLNKLTSKNEALLKPGDRVSSQNVTVLEWVKIET